MIVSLVLNLRATRPTVFPAYLGRASHAAFLRLVAQDDPALAERLHAPDARRPFTCSTLMGGRRGRPFHPTTGDKYTGRLSAVASINPPQEQCYAES